MAIHPMAGKPAPVELLIDVARVEGEYYARRPELSDAKQLASFDALAPQGKANADSRRFSEATV
jgi:phosphoglucomutase